MSKLKNISDIKHVLYINLEHRTDRKTHVLNELDKIGLVAERFNAVKLENGAIGCSMSHLKCVQHAKKMGWEHLCIVEDDITFTNPKLFIRQLNKFLKSQENWDVLLIGGNVVPPYEPVGDYCVKTTHTQTTIGYIVKSHYYDNLIENYKEGISLLLKNQENRFYYALDKYWFKLQEKDNWYIITPLTVTQKDNDYSDIEGRVTNYQHLMLDLDKEWMYGNTAINRQLQLQELQQQNKQNNNTDCLHFTG